MEEKRPKEHVFLYKLIYSIMIMFIYMIGKNIPLYGVDMRAYQQTDIDAQAILFQAMSGSMNNCTIFTIGLWPYMLASMVSILVIAIMSMDSTRKVSTKKINIWTMAIMMSIAIFQAYHKVQTLVYKSTDQLFLTKSVAFIQLIAGMLVVLYMCDRAVKYGIGGKSSVFMVNIIGGMMVMFSGQPMKKLILPIIIGIVEVGVMLVLETTEKRISVQRVSIHSIYADKNYIAYKLNPVGAMPFMFASAFFLLPQFLCSFLHYLYPYNKKIEWLMNNMSLNSKFGIIVYLIIIVLLTVSFAFVMLTPGKTADELLKTGDSIVNIYAGKDTKKYLIGSLFRFSIYSSLIICICQGIPLFLQFGGFIDPTLVMLPCSIMMSTGIWISFYREALVYKNMDNYKPFI